MMVKNIPKKIAATIVFFILFYVGSPAFGAAPEAPGGLAAIAGNSEVSLSWNAVTGATSYALYRSQTDGGPYSFVAQDQGTGHTDHGLANGTTYYYVVTALNTDGQSPYSPPVTIAPTANVLAAPANVKAIPGNGQISLTWSAVTSATSYNIYRAVARGGPYTLLTPAAAGPSYTDKDLTNGTQYFYVVQTKRTNTGAYSNEAFATPSAILPIAPVDFTISPGSTWAALSWSASDGADSYTLYRATTLGGPYAFAASAKTTSYEDTYLTNGTTYYYVLAAVNAAGRGAFSAEASAAVSSSQKPHAAVITGKPGNGACYLNWSSASGATSYTVRRGSSSGSYDTVFYNQSGGFTDSSVANGSTYYYIVDAHNASATIARSNEVAITPVSQFPAPSGVSFIPGNTEVTMFWTPVTGATGYWISASTTPGGTYVAGGGSGENPSFTIQNLTNGVPYYFRVQATGHTTASGYSAEVGITPMGGLPTAPINVGVSYHGNTQASLSWSAVDGATAYKIFRKTEGGTWPSEPVGTVTGTLFTDSGLTNGTLYFYKVAAVNADGTGAWSYEVNAHPVATCTPAPVKVKVLPGSTQATLMWDPVAGVDVYYITASISPGGTYVAGGSSSNPGFTITGLTNDQPYYFRVQSGTYSGPPSSYAAEVSATPTMDLPLAPINFYYNSSGNTQISLTWDAVDGATAYQIYRRMEGSAWPSGPVATVTGTMFTDSGLVNGANYYYKAAAVNTNGVGAWTQNELLAQPVAGASLAPVNVKVVPGSTQATLIWDPVVGATSYYIVAATSPGGVYYRGGSSSAPSFTVTNLTNTETYYFRVQATGTPVTSAPSTEVGTMPTTALLLAPANLTVTAGNGQLSIRWDAVSGATGYVIYRRTEGNPWPEVPTGTPTGSIFTDTGLVNGTKYYYIAAAVNANGVGAWSTSEVYGTPTGDAISAPLNVAATAGNTLATVTWDALPGATAYYVTIADSPGGPAINGSGNATGTTFTATGLTNSQTYYFRVQAAGNQWSAFSAEASATPNPAANVGNISGRVAVDIAGHSNLSVANAAISLQGTGYSTETDENGNFTLINVPLGNYTMVVSAPGMDTQTMAISLAQPALPVTVPQMVVTQSTGVPGDATGDDHLGIDDVIYILQVLSNLRQ